MKKMLFCLFFLVACQSSAPKRNFTVRLYETDAVCIRFLDDNGDRVIICDDSPNFPKDLIGITIDDYNKERGYQDRLINACKRWKK